MSSRSHHVDSNKAPNIATCSSSKYNARQLTIKIPPRKLVAAETATAAAAVSEGPSLRSDVLITPSRALSPVRPVSKRKIDSEYFPNGSSKVSGHRQAKKPRKFVPPEEGFPPEELPWDWQKVPRVRRRCFFLRRCAAEASCNPV